MRLPYFDQIRKSFEWLDTHLLFPVILLTSLLFCFGAGYLGVLYDQQGQLLIQKFTYTPSTTLDTVGDRGVVASKNGTTFYYPWCTGRNRIKPENERWFADPAEASKYGLKPAKNCLGL